MLLEEYDETISAWETFDEIYSEELSTIIKDTEAIRKNPTLKTTLKQNWNQLDPRTINKIWADFTREGFVKNEKYLDEIADRMITNIAKLYANTVMSGHTPSQPNSEIAQQLSLVFKGAPKVNSDDRRLPFTEHEFNELTDLYMSDPDTGQWNLSDYAMEPLLKLAIQIIQAKDPNEKIVLCDQVLNVVHQRGDIAKLFVKGGSLALTELFEK